MKYKNLELLGRRTVSTGLGKKTIFRYRHTETGGLLEFHQCADFAYWTALSHKGQQLGTYTLRESLAQLRRQHTERG